MTMAAKPTIRAFFDGPTNTVSYLVWDSGSKEGAVIDPVNVMTTSGKATMRQPTRSSRRQRTPRVSASVGCWRPTPADHLSGAPYIKLKTGAKVGIGAHIRDVQRISARCSTPPTVSGDGSEFDHLFNNNGERFKIGGLEGVVIEHSAIRRPACPTRSATRCSSATPCSCPITARRGRISPEAMRASFYRSIQTHPISAVGDAVVHVPRLQGART